MLLGKIVGRLCHILAAMMGEEGHFPLEPVVDMADARGQLAVGDRELETACGGGIAVVGLVVADAVAVAVDAVDAVDYAVAVGDVAGIADVEVAVAVIDIAVDYSHSELPGCNHLNASLALVSVVKRMKRLRPGRSLFETALGRSDAELVERSWCRPSQAVEMPQICLKILLHAAWMMAEVGCIQADIHAGWGDCWP